MGEVVEEGNPGSEVRRLFTEVVHTMPLLRLLTSHMYFRRGCIGCLVFAFALLRLCRIPDPFD